MAAKGKCVDQKSFIPMWFIVCVLILPLSSGLPSGKFKDYCQHLKQYRETHSNFTRLKHDRDGPCDTTEQWNANETGGIIGYSECHAKIWWKKTIPVLPDAVQFLKLKGRLREISESLFSNVTHLNLTYLDLSRTSLKVIHKGAFRWLENLTCLDLNYNRFLSEESFDEALRIPGLKWLDVNNCNLPIKKISPLVSRTASLQILRMRDSYLEEPARRTNWPDDFRSLVGLNLEATGLRSFRVLKVSRLQWLDLSYNRVYKFPSTCQNESSLFPKLTNLDLAYNRIPFINSSDLCLPKLRYLDVGFNKIRVVNGLPLKRLSTLVLSENKLRAHDDTSIAYTTFLSSNNKITSLEMNANDFTVVNEERFLQLFGHLRSLKTLSLVNTRLRTITANMFAPFVNLTALNLSGNYISDIPDGCFDALTNLRSLHLSTNVITTVRATTFSAQTRARLTGVRLSHNPFLCTCDLLAFRDWYLADRAKFIRPRELVVNMITPTSHYECTGPTGVAIPIANFTLVQQACILDRQTSLLLIVLQTVVITSITTFVLLFRYRWHIRLLLYEAFRGKGDARRRYLEEGHFNFDVFVSHADEQFHWVRDHLMPRLETGLGLKLCVHERDFIPGHNIVDNIVSGVQSSKKVMMVFTKAFVRSQWCQFELAYCLSHVMEHEDVLVVVCLDDVASRDMTPAMKAVLMTTTYIQWKGKFCDVELFWDRLGLALREVTGCRQARPSVPQLEDSGFWQSQEEEEQLALGRFSAHSDTFQMVPAEIGPINTDQLLNIFYT